MLFLSPITRGPEFTIPGIVFVNFGILGNGADGDASVGQVPFESRVSGRTEYLPVAVSLLAAHGKC